MCREVLRRHQEVTYRTFNMETQLRTTQHDRKHQEVFQRSLTANLYFISRCGFFYLIWLNTTFFGQQVMAKMNRKWSNKTRLIENGFIYADEFTQSRVKMRKSSTMLGNEAEPGLKLCLFLFSQTLKNNFWLISQLR